MRVLLKHTDTPGRKERQNHSGNEQRDKWRALHRGLATGRRGVSLGVTVWHGYLPPGPKAQGDT